MDNTSQVLAQGLLKGLGKLFHALADQSNIPCTTL